MRVNSVFIGFFTNRMVTGSRIAIVLFAVSFFASSFREYSDRDLSAKDVNLMIRQIGHRLLLQAGDSTSRIMPVTESKNGTFLLQFENELVFNHDSLVALSQNLLPKTNFPSGYTVTVYDCTKEDIVYGFRLNNTSPDVLACSGRNQLKGCYSIEFAFPDFYTPLEKQKAGTAGVTESAKVDTAPTDPKSEESKTKMGETVVYSGVLLLLGVAVLIGTGRFAKKVKLLRVKEHHKPVIKESASEYPALGKLLFNVKGQRLLLGREVINLTDKECKVLELLHENFGELIPRDTLMQKVWIDEGVITGRSLDMFVSKLRKKLSADPELRITNVHGKGYKLEIPEREII